MLMRRVFLRLLRNPNAVIGLSVLIVVLAMALLADVLYPGDPFGLVTKPYIWPFMDDVHWLGSDNLGRDVLSGIFHGSRTSLIIGFVSALICMVIGVVVGAVGGYFGGMVDRVLVTFTEAVQTMPAFLFLIVWVVIFEPSLFVITVGIGLVSWPAIARLTRAEYRSLREREFVMAAHGFGFRARYIILHEILPNAMPPLVVTTSIVVASAILYESALSFLGLGDPNMISWGTMIGNSRAVIRQAWYLSAIPGIAILITVMGINLLGEALNDELDPRAQVR